MKRWLVIALAVILVVGVGWLFYFKTYATIGQTAQGSMFYGWYDVGLRLSGTEVKTPTNDFSWTDTHRWVQIETKPWYKIPYHKGMELELDLTAIDGVYFDVFAPDQVRYWPGVGHTMGTSAPGPADPVYLKTWQGHMEQADYILDYYYVRVTNLLGFEISYILCSHETASTTVEPTGDSPANGLTAASCALLTLNPNAQVSFLRYRFRCFHSGGGQGLARSAAANRTWDCKQKRARVRHVLAGTSAV